MERNDREPAARRENPLGRFEAAEQLAELVIDHNAQRLEGARRRMGRFARPRRRDAGDHFGELERRDIGRRLAVGDDRAGDAARGALLAALGLVELHRRDADVERDAVDGGEAAAAGDRVELGEAALDQRQPAGEFGDERRPAGDRRGIAVDRNDARAGFEQRARISAGAEGAVDGDAAGTRRQRAEGLSEEHGNMAGRSAGGDPVFAAARCHAPASFALTPSSARSRRTRALASSRCVAKRDGSQI